MYLNLVTCPVRSKGKEALEYLTLVKTKLKMSADHILNRTFMNSSTVGGWLDG